jgi:hypothetical protein
VHNSGNEQGDRFLLGTRELENKPNKHSKKKNEAKFLDKRLPIGPKAL